VCALFPFIQWTHCQHRVGQSHFRHDLAMPLFACPLPLSLSSTLLHIVAIVALATGLILQPFPIIKLHCKHDMHGIVASHTSKGDNNVFSLAFLSDGFALACDFIIIHLQCCWLARTLLFLQLLELWWGRMFNASLEHLLAPWIKHSQLVLLPMETCSEWMLLPLIPLSHFMPDQSKCPKIQSAAVRFIC